MTEDKFILMGLNDERSKHISDVLGNKTCKKMIDYLSGVREASEKDISDALSMPINTIEYNLNKLIKSGLVEKSKNFFWSRKGRKIGMYKLANKRILISPRTIATNIVPVLIALFFGAFGIKVLTDNMNSRSVLNIQSTDSLSREAAQLAASEKIAPVADIGSNYFQNLCNISADAWAWFLLGGLFVILVFLLWNQFKKMKGGFGYEQ